MLLRAIEEIDHLQQQWHGTKINNQHSTLSDYFSRNKLENIGLFDKIQLHEVINICKTSKSLSGAGRKLFLLPAKKRTKPTMLTA